MPKNPFNKPTASKTETFSLNLKDVESGFKIDAGKYLAKIVDFQETKSKSSGNPMWVFDYQIIEGKYANKSKGKLKVFRSLQPNALFMLKNDLTALGLIDEDGKVKFDKKDCIGLKAYLLVVDDTNQDGEASSKVDKVLPWSEEVDEEEDDDEDTDDDEEDESDDDDSEETDDDDSEDEDDESEESDDEDDDEEDEDEIGDELEDFPEDEEDDEEEEEEEPKPKKPKKSDKKAKEDKKKASKPKKRPSLK